MGTKENQSDRRPDPLVGAQRSADPDRHGGAGRRRPVRGRAAVARRHSRPLRYPGHRLHRDAGASAAGRRGPGDLSADHRDAGGAEEPGGARLLLLRRIVRLRHLRGRHRHLLGAQPRPGISELRRAEAASQREADPGAGRDRRRLGLSIRRGRREPVAGGTSFAAGLVHPLWPRQGAWRRRGGERRRLRAAIQRRGRSAEAPQLRRAPVARHRGDPGLQPRDRRPRGRDGRGRVHGAGPRLSHRGRRSRADRAQGRWAGARADARRGAGRAGARRATRPQRTQWRGRGGGRHRVAALRPERARRDRRREGEAARDLGRLARGRADRGGL